MVTTHPMIRSSSAIRRGGAICLVAGLAGAASGIYLALMEPDVGTERFSYPQGAGEFLTMQVWFVIQHLGLLVGLVALAGSRAVPHTRLAVVGTYGAAMAMVGLTAMEAVAITARESMVDSTAVTLIGAGYGVVSLALGVTLVAAGIAIVRAGVWHGWQRWLVVAMGVWVFFPMTPALATMTDGARLAISGWMVLFAALGAALVRDPAPR